MRKSLFAIKFIEASCPLRMFQIFSLYLCVSVLVQYVLHARQMRGRLVLRLILLKMLSAACMTVHLVGSVGAPIEPMPHVMFFCGTYVAFFLISLMACIAMCLGIAVPILLQTGVAYCGALCFCIASMVSMIYVENDSHMMYLTDYEEWLHPYFYMHRLQSIFSLFTGLWYLMHAILTTDMLIIQEQNPNETDLAYQPLQLHFFFEHIIGHCQDHCKMCRFSKCSIKTSTERRIDLAI